MQGTRHSGIRQLVSLLLLCILLQFPSASAKQLKFVHLPSASKHQFSYSWQAHDAHYQLDFAIPFSAFTNMPSTQAAFSNAIMQREVEVALLKYAKSVDPRRGRISIQFRNNRLEYGVRSVSPSAGQEIMGELKALSAEASTRYLNDNFYMDYVSTMGADAIKHDHAKYAALSTEAILPIVDAIKALQQNVNDPREFIQIALSWMQSIPYNTLENRVSSNGAGYVSPKDLLLQNQGDCDSKATFLAALMKGYSAALQQTLVLLPKHALLAIAVRAKPNEKTISKDGIDYVLLEAAGPGYFNIGEVSDSTMMGIRNRQYTLETM